MVNHKVKATLASLLFLNCSLFSGSPEDRISELEKQMLEVSTVTQAGNIGARFASSGQAFSGCKWLLTFDTILWKAKTGASSFAYSVSRAAPDGLAFPQNGTISEIDFGWSWGFKAGVGMQTSHNDWDLYLQYTRYHTSASAGSRKDLPSGFLGLTGFLDPALCSRSSYKLHYDDVTLNMGKAYFLSEKLMTKPFFGIKTTWMSQKQDSRYVFDTRSGTLISFASQLRDSCKFWGIGPGAGFYTQWYLDGGFSLLSEVGVSLLYGYYKCEDFYRTDEARQQNGNTVVSFGSADLKGSVHHYSPFANFQIGLSYERSYSDDKVFFLCKLFYESQFFFRQEDKIVVEGAVRTGPTPNLMNTSKVRFSRESEDIGFHGVTFRMELFF